LAAPLDSSTEKFNTTNNETPLATSNSHTPRCLLVLTTTKEEEDNTSPNKIIQYKKRATTKIQQRKRKSTPPCQKGGSRMTITMLSRGVMSTVAASRIKIEEVKTFNSRQEKEENS